MKADYWRNGAAAILAAGLLTIAAVAQTGEASGEVKIEGEKPATTTTTTKVQTKIVKPAKPVITDRDPFVNQVDSGVVVGGAVQSRAPRVSTAGATVRPAASVGKSVVGVKGAKVEPVVEEVIVPAPEVTITGIVKSGGGRQAIVNSQTGSRIVVQGERVGDYRVGAITDTAVTFTHSGKSFKIPMESEFGGPKK